MAQISRMPLRAPTLPGTICSNSSSLLASVAPCVCTRGGINGWKVCVSTGLAGDGVTGSAAGDVTDCAGVGVTDWTGGGVSDWTGGAVSDCAGGGVSDCAGGGVTGWAGAGVIGCDDGVSVLTNNSCSPYVWLRFTQTAVVEWRRRRREQREMIRDLGLISIILAGKAEGR